MTGYTEMVYQQAVIYSSIKPAEAELCLIVVWRVYIVYITRV